jgi:SP family general alpha glucoside:H+ symporter-like MFS transporter
MDPEKTSDVTTHEEEHARNEQLGHLANAEDHETSKWQAIRRNPWAFAWCMYAVWTILLVSFENQASGNILGIPEFRKDFGSFYDGNWVLSAKWQSAFSGAPIASYVYPMELILFKPSLIEMCRQIVGNLGSGQIADWIGRRNTLIIALVISFVAITMEFVATTNELFFGGKFLKYVFPHYCYMIPSQNFHFYHAGAILLILTVVSLLVPSKPSQRRILAR